MENADLDLFDALFNFDEFKPFEYPLTVQEEENLGEIEELGEFQFKPHEQRSSPTEANSIEDSGRQEGGKSNQSILHNCPKKLIKHLALCLNFPTTNILQSPAFTELGTALKLNLKNLLSIFQLCFKGRVKSLSKQLLKLIYQEGSERNSKSKLLQVPSIRKLIHGCDPSQMPQAKSILRAFTLQKLEDFRSVYIDHQDPTLRGINTRYLQKFKEQLRVGRVSERVSKQDKEWILQSKNF